MKKILVTGASGFVGQSLCKTLLKSGKSVIGAVRSLNSFLIDNGINYLEVGDIGDIKVKKYWKNFLINVDCIIHCAGKAHIMNNDKNFDIYRFTNLDGTKHLAEVAVKAGVKRLIFLSTIKVNGEITYNDYSKNKFCHNDIPVPKDIYAISKLEAEKLLWEISLRTGLEVVVIRLPLVYGYGVKGNLASLIKLIKSGIPLPLNMIVNQRSMIGIDNLVDLLIRCVDHPEATGKTFLASDGKDLSTPDLVRYIASSMGLSARLFPLPLSLLKFFGFLLGKKLEIDRLIGSLRIDNSYTKEILNWTPPISVEEGIRRMVQGK